MEKKSLVVGDVLGHRYQIKARIGTGGFAELYLGEDLVDGKEVAVKAQVVSMTSNALKVESEVLGKIDGFAPKLYHYCGGEEGGRKVSPYIVMELLKGEDMSEMRHRQPSSRIPLGIAVHLAQEMIRLLQNLHALGFIHRDIKPNNFMRKSRKDKDFWLIDFGIAKNIMTEGGDIKPERKNADFRGTTMYASLRAHQSKDQSKRDDLISTFFVFLDLSLGRLPWTDEAKAKNKAVVQELKEKFMKEPTSIIEEDAEFSARPNKEQLTGLIAEITTYLHGLGYEDEPDYDKVIKLFDQLGALGTEEENKAFDWIGEGTSPSGFQRAKLEEHNIDTGTRLAILGKQVQALVSLSKEEEKGGGVGGGAAAGGGGAGRPAMMEEIEIANEWSRVSKRALEEKSDRYDGTQRMEHLNQLLQVAKRYDTFFLLEGLSDEEFATFQLDVVYKVEKAYSKARKKLKSSASG